ncbi:MAG: hypothetical protein AMDU4_FER2C00137G0045 [Ferroplasma sp. Type II]|jgi:hypothetical protein|uniref:hypothetical protein n=1 Tax=Ferroplasma sp. Type II TaxID=261388 RepID=UPI0003895BE9|nr:hypothetical protein [Ferroplasma sp. Type II]EQB72492.1 MAG: hypothetical protein AMDU4_FER2C00137G0045 [Ferroplasma sp. Type II]HIH60237.1 hypothetical protein [Ferroplasma sp.]HII82865.1 hypothetical protein [Ferroplasma sp.]
MDISGYILLAIALIDGLLFGLAIKKGIVSAILLIIAFILAGYAGLSFIPNISTSKVISYATTFFYKNMSNAPGLLNLGHAGAVTIVLVLFLIGLGIGIWKG